MAILKCKMCGGELNIQDGMTVAECEYCGTTQTLPKLVSDDIANLYDRANHFRRNNEFDKAEGIYERILSQTPEDAEAYWSLVLCRYGIEYVEDPATHKRVPTVNRTQYTSIFDDENYKSAIEHADAIQRRVYEEEAAAINEIQKGILAISQKEEPFDVFICYKETDRNGRRTPDSVLATDLYHQLINEGFKVFFARITLEDKLGTAYEPYIFAALNSAKVMVALGTKPEYFNAVWVKNEWSRYLALVKQSNGKKVLIPAYRDMDPYNLPEEFSHLQAQDMSKLGFMQDLIRGIKKITKADEPKTQPQAQAAVASTALNDIDPLLKRMFMYIEDGEWDKANEYSERVLDKDPENAEAYLGKLMADIRVCRREELKNQTQPFDGNKHYQKAIRFADAKIKDELTGYIDCIKNRKEEKERKQAKERLKIEQEDKEQAYADASALMNNAKSLADYVKVKGELQRALPIHDSEEMLKKTNDIIDQMYLSFEEKRQLFIKISELTNEINRLSAEYYNLENKIAKYNKKIEKELELKKEQESLNAGIITLEKELSGLGKFAFSQKKKVKEELAKTNQKLETIQRELQSISIELNATNIDTERENLAKVDEEISKVKCELEETENNLRNEKGPKVKNTEYGLQSGDVLYLNESLAEKNELVENDALKGYIKENNISSIVIPNSFTGIGKSAFKNCSNLICIVIPDSVTSIEGYAFYGCESLTNIVIPDSVTSIDEWAFSDCRNLTSIVIPDSVTSIEGYAFYGCESLTSIVIPDSITSIGYSAFDGCVNLTSIVIPDSVTSIEGHAFFGCRNLTRIVIPDSVTSLGEYVFHGCSRLKRINIPCNVREIGEGLLANAGNLKIITVDSMNDTYDSRDNCNAVIETATNTLLCSCLSTVIPNSVTSIGNGAFSCTRLKSINIPGSVTSIDKWSFFASLVDITISIPDSVTHIADDAFECSEGTTICGHKGSYAEKYAKKNNIAFKYI